MVRTMVRRDGNAENFWSVARLCATGKQLAAVSNISAGSPFVDWSVPVSVVPFPAVEYFPTARNYAFVAQHFLDHRRRWRHLKHKTRRMTRVGVYFPKSKAMLARRMEDTMHFTVKVNANVEAPTRICSARMRKYLSTTVFLWKRIVKPTDRHYVVRIA